MQDKKNIIGVVLAGGRSSRMGKNKALLEYNGKPLLDHMISLLKSAGLSDIYVSGKIDGYRCIPDQEQHEGPAWAMHDVITYLKFPDRVLFIPVDMPLLSVEALRLLMKQEHGGYFENEFLPALITIPYPVKRLKSVQEFLEAANTPPITLPETLKYCMNNTNTPEEWKAALSA